MMVHQSHHNTIGILMTFFHQNALSLQFDSLTCLYSGRTKQKRICCIVQFLCFTSHSQSPMSFSFLYTTIAIVNEMENKKNSSLQFPFFSLSCFEVILWNNQFAKFLTREIYPYTCELHNNYL